jgi:type I restriction enzyme M protein
MAIKKSQLYSMLWEGCDALRGGMDASLYKDYVLVMLFLKYISDKKKAGDEDMMEDLPDDCTFDEIRKLKHKNDIGEQINVKLAKIANAFGLDNVFVNADFDNEDKLGKGKDKVDTITGLVEVFENKNLDFGTNRAGDDDLIGDAYEYLMRNFASQSGKSKGQFYTPAEVSRLMARIIGISKDHRPLINIYDPACGSGSLLLRARDEAPKEGVNVGIYGQEKDLSTISMAKMNMILHGMMTADLQQGDTLNIPLHTHGVKLDQFDYVVANPPFSLKKWMKSAKEDDVYGRWKKVIGVPPTSKGDYAFLLHIIESMKADGMGACILPHGVLFRGSVEKGEAEAKIRKHLIDKKVIRGIIGLPSNLFYGTGIPACIIIIDKKNAAISKGIFMMDAKEGFKKDGAKNRLREQDIRRISDAWEAGKKMDHFCRLVEWEEIERNEYNLNIPRYITPRSTEVVQNLYAHIHGGLPLVDIDSLEMLWNVCPSLRDKIFEPYENDGYMQLTQKADSHLAQLIEQDESYKQQVDNYNGAFETWHQFMREELRTLCIGSVPRKAIVRWSDEILRIFKSSCSLVDAYAVYDELMTYWNEVTMQDDLYLISRDGWKVTVELPTNKKGEVKKTYSYEDLTCDLVPSSILVNRYFAKEQADVTNTRQLIDAEQVAMETITEEYADAFEDIESDKVNAKFCKAVGVLLKEGKKHPADNADYIPVWEDFLKHFKEQEQLKKDLKEKVARLTASVLKKYKVLTEEEIRTMVFEDKWMPDMRNRMQALMTAEQQNIITSITALNERYKVTLPEMEADVNRYRDIVKGYLQKMGVEF